MAGSHATLLFALILSAAPLIILAADADPLQDFCVANFSTALPHISGYACNDPAQATVDDFVFHGLAHRANTSTSPQNATATFAFVENFPGLNTLGIGMARLDFGLGGLIVPHTHPRGSEIIFVIEGSLYAGFVDTNNTLFAKVINAGDVMIFPRGLIHFQLNVGNGPATAVVALNSQDAGFQIIASSMFGSNIMDEVLEKAFFLTETDVEELKAAFSS